MHTIVVLFLANIKNQTCLGMKQQTRSFVNSRPMAAVADTCKHQSLVTEVGVKAVTEGMHRKCGIARLGCLIGMWGIPALVKQWATTAGDDFEYCVTPRYNTNHTGSFLLLFPRES